MSFAEECIFPTIVLQKGSVIVYEELDGLTLCSMSDVKAGSQGRFAHSHIVDCAGHEWVMEGAKVVSGVGPLWGYNLFLNRRVRVLPCILSGPSIADFAAVKRELVKRMETPDAVTIKLKKYCTVMEHATALSLIPSVLQAQTIVDTIHLLLAGVLPQRE